MKNPRRLLLACLVAALPCAGAIADVRTGSKQDTFGGSYLGADYTAYAGVLNGPNNSRYLGAANYLQAHVSLFRKRREALYAGAHAWVRSGSSSSDMLVRVAGHQFVNSSQPLSNSLNRTNFHRVGAEADVFTFWGIFSIRVGVGAGVGYNVDINLVSRTGAATVGENLRGYAYMDLSAGITILWGVGSAGIRQQGWFLDTEFDALLSATTNNLFGNAWIEFRPLRIVLKLWAEAAWGALRTEKTLVDYTPISIRVPLINW